LPIVGRPSKKAKLKPIPKVVFTSIQSSPIDREEAILDKKLFISGSAELIVSTIN
jgi:hypothetical protein